MTQFLMNKATAPLQPKDELELFARRKVATGAEREQITSQLLLANLRFIKVIASGCRNRYCPPLEDMVSDGILAALKAMDSFDPSRGVAFRSWAWRQIKTGIIDSILAHILGERFVKSHKPKRNEIMKRIYGLRDFYAYRASERGMSPTLADLMDDAGFDADEVRLYLYAFREEDNIWEADEASTSSMILEQVIGSSGLNPEQEYEMKELRREIGEVALAYLSCPKSNLYKRPAVAPKVQRKLMKTAIRESRDYISDYHPTGVNMD